MTVIIPLFAAVLGLNRQRLNEVDSQEYTPLRTSSMTFPWMSRRYCLWLHRYCGLVCSSVPVTSVTLHESSGPKKPFAPRASSVSTKQPESTIVNWGNVCFSCSWCVVKASCVS